MASTEITATSPTPSNTAAVDSDPDGSGSRPFDDPVQRTRCLIQYIRLRKQRAEAEQLKRTALKKQKMDARATLHSAREELAQAGNEQRQLERRVDVLNQEKHQLLINLKNIHQREMERKRQREEERQRRMLAIAEEQRLAAVAAAQQQQMDTLLQLKNVQHLLSSLIAAATGGGPTSGAAQNTTLSPTVSALLPSLSQLILPSLTANSTGSSGNTAYEGQSSSSATSLIAALAAASQQQHGLAKHFNPYGQLAATATAHQAATATAHHQPPISQTHSSHQQQPLQSHHQQQQVQNAVTNLLRHHYPAGVSLGSGSSSGTSAVHQAQASVQMPQQTTPHHSYASVLQQHLDFQSRAHLPTTLNIHTALTAASGGTGGGVISSPNSAPSNAVSLPPELLYHAALLAANMSANNAAGAGNQIQPPK